jgi:hypothetical protein
VPAIAAIRPQRRLPSLLYRRLPACGGGDWTRRVAVARLAEIQLVSGEAGWQPAKQRRGQEKAVHTNDLAD